MSAVTRNRHALLAVIITVFVLVYISTGASSTRNSDFYKKTVQYMEARGHGDGSAHDFYKRWPNIADFGSSSRSVRKNIKKSTSSQKHENAPSERTVHAPRAIGFSENAQKVLAADVERNLRERLKQAEKQAKKSADEKYRALKDVEAEIQKDREVRKKAAAEESPKGAAATGGARDLAPGEKSIAGRTKMPAAAVNALGPQASAALSRLTGMDDYESPLIPQPGETEEQRTLRETYASFLTASPVVIFSKSYCPHSKKAKRILLSDNTITPTPKVVELDLHPLGAELQNLLQRLTNRRTVPNVLVDGHTIGGGDEVEMLWKSGELPARIRQMGGRRVSKVVENVAYDKAGLISQQKGLKSR